MTESVGRVIVDATTEDTLEVDSSGRAAIQDQPNMDVALSTRATETTAAGIKTGTDKIPADPAREGGNLATLAAVDFATETTLDAIKDTDGIKKITDPLPAGTNEIGKVQITDGTNETSVTEDGRLRVDASASAGEGLVNDYLETSGGSAEMAINGGAGTVFSWSPDSDNDVEGISLSLIIEDATIYFGDKWGGISDLTNGFLIEVKASNVPFTLANLRRTRELWQLSEPGAFAVYAASPDALKAELSLSGLIFRKAGTYVTDDYVRATVRDNLSGLSHQSALFKGARIG